MCSRFILFFLNSMGNFLGHICCLQPLPWRLHTTGKMWMTQGACSHSWYSICSINWIRWKRGGVTGWTIARLYYLLVPYYSAMNQNFAALQTSASQPTMAVSYLNMMSPSVLVKRSRSSKRHSTAWIYSKALASSNSYALCASNNA